MGLIQAASIWLLGAFNLGLVIYAFRPFKDDDKA
jgi:hypothetical protein